MENDDFNCDCPSCGSRAYQGLSFIECSNSACVRYKPFYRTVSDNEETKAEIEVPKSEPVDTDEPS